VPSNRPNIVFILSDDHAVQAISALNPERPLNRTPALDRLAREGGVFRESFCCNSICTPSRAAILTGKHSLQNGVLTLGDALADDQVTFPGLLKRSGYTTALVGKWHLNCDPRDGDFDFWEVLPKQGHYYNPDYKTRDGMIRREGYVTDISTDRMIEWLENDRDPAKPFLACLQFKAPHRPWMPPPRHYHLFDGHRFPEPPTLRDDYANRCAVLGKNEMTIARHMRFNTDLKVREPGPNADRLAMHTPKNAEWEWDRMTPAQLEAWEAAYRSRVEHVQSRRMTDSEFESWAYQTYITDYLGCVAALDDNVGRMLDWLDAQGLADDTIVVYCSDQGFYLGEHGWHDKRWIFEESMRMPLLVRWPGTIAPGSCYDALVQNIDYAPTLLEAAGLDAPPDMQGTSLLRLVDGAEAIHDDLYYHYYQHGGMGVPAHDGIRTKTTKLIHFYTEGEFNLFDLASDPFEMRSVHDDPAWAPTLSDMKARYHRARQRYAIPDEYGPGGRFSRL